MRSTSAKVDAKRIVRLKTLGHPSRTLSTLIGWGCGKLCFRGRPQHHQHTGLAAATSPPPPPLHSPYAPPPPQCLRLAPSPPSCARARPLPPPSSPAPPSDPRPPPPHSRQPQETAPVASVHHLQTSVQPGLCASTRRRTASSTMPETTSS